MIEGSEDEPSFGLHNSEHLPNPQAERLRNLKASRYTGIVFKQNPVYLHGLHFQIRPRPKKEDSPRPVPMDGRVWSRGEKKRVIMEPVAMCRIARGRFRDGEPPTSKYEAMFTNKSGYEDCRLLE